MSVARIHDVRETHPRAPLLRAVALACTALVFGVAQAAGAGSTTSAASASATTGDSAQARYQRERARCLAGKSQEDTQTCLREAGAALQAAHEHDLKDPGSDQEAANARRRCEVFKTDADRNACLARVSGDGTTSGSVAAGGVMHEYTQTIPAPDGARAAPATLPTPPSPAVLPAANAPAPVNPVSPAPPAR